MSTEDLEARYRDYAKAVEAGLQADMPEDAKKTAIVVALDKAIQGDIDHVLGEAEKEIKKTVDDIDAEVAALGAEPAESAPVEVAPQAPNDTEELAKVRATLAV